MEYTKQTIIDSFLEEQRYTETKLEAETKAQFITRKQNEWVKTVGVNNLIRKESEQKAREISDAMNSVSI